MARFPRLLRPWRFGHASVLSMNGRLAALLPLLLALNFPLNAGAEPLLAIQMEIDHLLGYVESSRCEFQRNGNWYDSQKALVHLRSKYGFLRNSVSTAEDFIEKAASRSSITGQPYQVRCGRDAPLPSSQWLLDELIRFRAILSQSLR
jgi:uncharacterized protein DUF5329